MAGKRVLSIGQCGADHYSLSRTLREHFDAEVLSADSADEALRMLGSDSFDLVLVNRILDADGSAGIALIRRMQEDESLRRVPVMLVSNYEDAQREARQAGALLGFGKGSLGHPAMLARLRPLLA